MDPDSRYKIQQQIKKGRHSYENFRGNAFFRIVSYFFSDLFGLSSE